MKPSERGLEDGRLALSTKLLEQNPGDMVLDPELVHNNAEVMAAHYRFKP